MPSFFHIFAGLRSNMSDPWQAVDPWGGTNTVPNNSYYPPAAASAPSQRWTDANGNEYILDIQGETVTASCEKLNYHESGTLKNGKLGLFGTWHDYTPEKITFGPPLSTSWTRVDQGRSRSPGLVTWPCNVSAAPVSSKKIQVKGILIALESALSKRVKIWQAVDIRASAIKLVAFAK